MDSQDTVSRRQAGWLFAITTALAAVMRLVYLFDVRGSALFETPLRDSIVYVDRAKGILAGEFWGSGVSFHSAPLYPYFLASVMGPTIINELWWVRVVQALLSAATAGVLALIALQLFGRVAAVATAILAIFYAPYIFYSGELLEITLTLLFLSLAVWQMSAATRPGGRQLFAIGAFIGLAALGKPNLLLLAPVALLAYARPTPILRPRLWPWRRLLILLVGLLVVVAPFTLRNRLVGGDWVLISSNGGINFFIGNNPQSSGGFLVPTEFRADLEHTQHRFAEEQTGKVMRPSAVSRFWAGRAWRFFATEPLAAARNLGRKAALLVNHYEIPNHYNFYFFREQYSQLLRLPLVSFAIILPLAALGLVFGLRRDRRRRLMGWSLLVSTLGVIAFFITSRYRLPLTIWLLPLAGYGVSLLIALLGRKRWALLPAALIVVLAGAALTHLPLLPAQNFHEDYITLSNAAFREGDLQAAARYSEQALRESDLKSSVAWQNLGYAHMELGDIRRAETCLWSALEIDPMLAHAWGNLAAVYSRQGYDRPILAMACADRASELDPDLAVRLKPMASQTRFVLKSWDERMRKTLSRVEASIERYPGRLGYQLDRVEILGFQLEDYEAAREVLSALPLAEMRADTLLAPRLRGLEQKLELADRFSPLIR